MSSTIPAAVRAAEDALLEHLLRNEVVIFVGDTAPLHDMQVVIESLHDVLPDHRPPTAEDGLDPLDVAQWYADEHGHQHLEMRVTRAYDLAQPKPSALQRTLMVLPVDLIFTTGYDQTLEHALYDDGIAPNVYIDDVQVFQINDRSGTSLIKLYGCVSRPDSLVLTRDDYDGYIDRHRAFVAFLQAQLATRVVLFVGFSFSEPRFRTLHTIIRQILQTSGRRAVALEVAPLQSLLASQWKHTGIDFVVFPDASALLAFVDRLSTRVAQTQQSLELSTMVQSLHTAGAAPMLTSAVSIVPTLETLRRQVRRLLREASRHVVLGLEPRLQEIVGEAESSGLSTVQTLYRLACSLEQAGFGLEVKEWRQIGNGLYRHRVWPVAIQAYTTALRIAQGADPWTEGDLARAYLRLDQHARAEGLLRQLVFIRSPDDQALNILWLVQRPSDLIELGNAVLRRAERLRDEGKPVQALAVLKDMRPWLRKGLGAPWMMALVQVEHQVRSYHPYLLNGFAANYRLAYELSVLVRQFVEAEGFQTQAVKLFGQALQETPSLAEPREHLIAIYYENLLRQPTATNNLRLQIEQIEALATTDESGRIMRDILRSRHVRAWRLAGNE